MDLLPLLDELQTIARNGLAYTANPYDRERYQRLLDLAVAHYSQALSLPAPAVRERLSAELGYITPKVGAEAGIVDEEGRVLLVLRADDESWCLPCGWVEPNEAPADTAVRETFEETGLEVRTAGLVDAFSLSPAAGGSVHSQIAIVYACEVTGGTIRSSHENLDTRYWRIEDVPAWHTQHRTYAEAARSWWEKHRKSIIADK